MYKKFDYIIQIDAPVSERENRVLDRNDILFKTIKTETMEKRDKEFLESLKKGKRRIDIKINNGGNIEELQRNADVIYQKIMNENKHISNTIIKRYGRYKIKPINMNRISSINRTEEKSNKTR